VNSGGRPLAALALLAGVIAVPACLVIGRQVLPQHGLNRTNGYALISPCAGPTLRAALGTAVYLALVALLSLGIATMIRDTAVPTGTVLGVLYVLPIAAQLVNDPTWRRHLQQIAPMTAGLAIQATTNLHSLPISPWTGLGVLIAWASGTLIGAGLSLHLRDA